MRKNFIENLAVFAISFAGVFAASPAFAQQCGDGVSCNPPSPINLGTTTTNQGGNGFGGNGTGGNATGGTGGNSSSTGIGNGGSARSNSTSISTGGHTTANPTANGGEGGKGGNATSNQTATGGDSTSQGGNATGGNVKVEGDFQFTAPSVANIPGAQSETFHCGPLGGSSGTYAEGFTLPFVGGGYAKTAPAGQTGAYGMIIQALQEGTLGDLVKLCGGANQQPPTPRLVVPPVNREVPPLPRG